MAVSHGVSAGVAPLKVTPMLGKLSGGRLGSPKRDSRPPLGLLGSTSRMNESWSDVGI